MIDTQQQYINLNIRGEISIIVVQAHSGRKRDIQVSDSYICVKERHKCKYTEHYLFIHYFESNI